MAEDKSIFSDTADGFHSHRKIYDSLSTHIMMYKDAKLSKKDIYTAYSNFKGAFGGMDHHILYIPTRERIRIPRLIYRHKLTTILRL